VTDYRGKRDTGNRACEERQAGHPACARWLAAFPSFLSAPPVGTGVPPVVGRSGGRGNTRWSRPASSGPGCTVFGVRQFLCRFWVGAHPRKYLSPRSPSPPRKPLRGVLSVLTCPQVRAWSSRSSPRRPPKRPTHAAAEDGEDLGPDPKIRGR